MKVNLEAEEFHHRGTENRSTVKRMMGMGFWATARWKNGRMEGWKSGAFYVPFKPF
jgi:hypothetical protein